MPSVAFGNIIPVTLAHSNSSAEYNKPDYFSLWEAWENNAEPGSGEFRNIAVERMLACLESGNETLNLADLELCSLPDELPPNIKSLILTNNQFTSLPDRYLSSLQVLFIDNNPLTEQALQSVKIMTSMADYQGPVIHCGPTAMHDEMIPLMNDGDSALQEVLCDGREIRLRVEDELRYIDWMKNALTSRPAKAAGGLIAGVTLFSAATTFFRNQWSTSSASGDTPADSELPPAALAIRERTSTETLANTTLLSAIPTQEVQLSAAEAVELNIINFFKTENVSVVDSKPTKEALASYVAGWVFPPGKPAEPDDNVIKLARHILLVSGSYGGKEGEDLSLRTAKTVIRQWVIHLLLDKTMPEFIAERLIADTGGRYSTFGGLKKIITLPILFLSGKLQLKNIPAGNLDSFETMWQSYINAEIPLLNNKKFKGALRKKFTQYEFLALYAGAEYLAAQGRLENFSLKEITETGASIWGNTVSGSNCADMLPWITTAALWYAARASPNLFSVQSAPDIKRIVPAVLNEWKNAQEQANKIQGYLTAYQNAQDVWSNKEALANKIIARCPLDKIQYAPSWGDDIIPQYKVNHKIRAGAKERYLLYNVAPCQREDVPASLTVEYSRLTNDVASAYKNLDRVLLEVALTSASKAEYDFIFSPAASIHAAQLNMVSGPAYFTGGAEYYGGETSAYIRVKLKNTEIFAVRSNNEERIYGLQKMDGKSEGYSFLRLDRDVKLYIEHDILDNEKFWVNAAIDGNEVKSGRNKFKFYILVDRDSSLYGKKGTASDDFFDFFSEKHRNVFYGALYQSGNSLSETEKLWSALKPIVPFFDCIEGLVSGQPEQVIGAIPSCFLDILAVLPVIGQANALSGKFGLSLTQGIRSGVLKASQGATAKAIASTIAAGAVLPAPKEIRSLLANMLRAFDPGFEPLFRAGAQLASISSGVGDLMLATKLNAKAPLAAPQARFRNAWLPGNAAEITIKELSENVWIRVNTETGEGFGKYYKLNNNQLTEIPVHYYRPQDPQPSGSQTLLPVSEPLTAPVEYKQLPQVPGNAAWWNTIKEVTNSLPELPKQPSPDNTLQPLAHFLPEVPLWVDTIESVDKLIIKGINGYFSQYAWQAWPGVASNALRVPPPWIAQMQIELRAHAEQSLQTFELARRMLWRIETFGGLMESNVGVYLANLLDTRNSQIIREAFDVLIKVVKRGYKYAKATMDVNLNNLVILSSDLVVDPENPSRYISPLSKDHLMEKLPYAVTMLSDPEARIFFFADKYFNRFITPVPVTNALNHEITHASSNVRDIFIHFYPQPGTLNSGQNVKEIFYKNLLVRDGPDAPAAIFQNKNFMGMIKRVRISQGITGSLSNDEIALAVLSDSKLRAWVLMSDAEVLATIIRDTVVEREFDSVIRVARDTDSTIDEQSQNATQANSAEYLLQNMLTLTVIQSLRARNYTVPAQ